MSYHLNPVYREAVRAAFFKKQETAVLKMRKEARQVRGTDALNRHPDKGAFVEDIKIQEARAKFKETCKHRAPRRRSFMHEGIRRAVVDNYDQLP